jgi:hypothetical protein
VPRHRSLRRSLGSRASPDCEFEPRRLHPVARARGTDSVAPRVEFVTRDGVTAVQETSLSAGGSRSPPLRGPSASRPTQTAPDLMVEVRGLMDPSMLASVALSWFQNLLSEGLLNRDGIRLSDEEARRCEHIVARAAVISQIEQSREDTFRMVRECVLAVVAVALVAAALVGIWDVRWEAGLAYGAALTIGLAAVFMASAAVHDSLRVILPAVVIGLGAAVVTLSNPYPGTAAAIALSVPLAGVALLWLALLDFIVGTAIGAMRRHQGPDPFAVLILRLLAALTLIVQLRHAQVPEGDPPMVEAELGVSRDRYPPLPPRQGPVWDLNVRTRIVRILDPAARAYEAYAPSLGRRSLVASSEVSDIVADRARRVASWIRDVEVQVLWPSHRTPVLLERRLGDAIVRACAGEWQELQREPRASAPKSAARRALTRVPLAVALLAAAFVIPRSVGDETTTALRATLILAALSALISPEQAGSDAVRAVIELGKRK